MIRRGNIQNDKDKSPGYVGRTLHRNDVLMLVNAHRDHILYSSGFGDTYSTVATANAPFSFNIVNSHPSAVAAGKDRMVSCNMGRACVYNTIGGRASGAFDYQTRFIDKDGIRSTLNLNSNNYFRGYNCLISDDGTRRMFLARAKFNDWDSVKPVLLSYTGGNWYRYETFSSVTFYDLSASSDLKILVNLTEKSTDYGVTVTSLNPGTGYTIVDTALSATGKVLYAIREKKRDSSHISEAWLSLSYDLGSHWINVVDLLPLNPNQSITSKSKSNVVTDESGDCVAFVYNRTNFGWSPNRGTFVYYKVLDYDHYYNLVSMDRSGYYISITNTNTVLPSPYFQNDEITVFYTLDMHTLESGLSNINAGVETCAATAFLR